MNQTDIFDIMQAAIFDMDGTLIDSMGHWMTVDSRYLRKIGKEPKPDLQERLKSMTMRQCAKFLKEDYGITFSEDEIIEGINSLIASAYQKEIMEKEGIFDVLNRLKFQNIPMAVITGSDKFLVETIFDRLQLSSYFDKIITCSEFGSGKDSPEIFLHTCRELGVSAAHTVVFEDAYYSMCVAKAAGFPVAAIWDPSNSPEEEQTRRLADWYFSSWKELA